MELQTAGCFYFIFQNFYNNKSPMQTYTYAIKKKLKKGKITLDKCRECE